MLRLAPFLTLFFAFAIHAHERTAHYLANEGVMVEIGETKIVFDPLFDNDYGRFEMLPEEMKAALLTGQAPYNNLSAALISHSHGDHFSPVDMVTLLTNHSTLKLFAPTQAVKDLKSAENFNDALLSRVTAIEPSDSPQHFELEGVVIDAHTIPHAGWPERMTEVHNLVYRVTLKDTTVVHLGDADTKDHHFEPNAAHWEEKQVHIAFPPYWYLYSENGKKVLEDRLKAKQVVGIHVPKAMPDENEQRPEEYRGPDLFTRPGETRTINVN